MKLLREVAGLTQAQLGERRPLLDEETIEQGVTARTERRKLFARRPAPLLSFVIEESHARFTTHAGSAVENVPGTSPVDGDPCDGR
ncbi:hypothetical protein ACFSUJ_21065 [Streptomyces lusitanus]|uniref:hypothetical protein n=1 Tax=Streptomyces lusitanus TaxID=68232 RepID=UPI003618AC37